MRPQHEHATSASRGAADDCTRHRPEDTVLYSTVQAHWKTFVVRQWVLTVPHGLRARMMFDPALTSAVLRELIRAISSWLRTAVESCTNVPDVRWL